MYVVPCFQQWQDVLMMSDADAQLWPLHIILCVILKPLSQRMGTLRLLTSPER